MDKLKPVLDIVKKYGFWCLIGVSVLVILGCWWMATNSVAADVKTKRDAIDGTFKSIEDIAAMSSHPNDKYLAAMEEEHKKLKDKVLAAWKALYEEQQKKNPWPEVLGKEFLDMIKELKPDEAIPYSFRGRYLNFIKEYFPTLKDMVDWRHPKDEAAAAVGAVAQPTAGALPQIEMVGVVDWEPSDIAKLEKEFDWSTTPSDLKIKLKQEDLWVIQSLLRVIKNTNGGITEHSKAAVKRIEALDIGPYAVQAWQEAEGQVFRGGDVAAVAEGGTGIGTGTPPPPAGDAAPSEDESLMRGRYVDDKGEPLPAGTKPPNAEFKMMPIRMKIQIDQRKIARLLAECANSEMPIEIRRVRIKPGEGEMVDFNAASGTGGGGARPIGMPGMPGGMPGGYGPPGGMPGGYGPQGGMPGGYGGYGKGAYGGMGGYGRMEGGGMRPPMAPGLPGVEGAWEKGPMDIPVEIQGIICIYNPPDITKLGTGTASSGAASTLPADTPAASPAATPATPVAPAAPPATLGTPADPASDATTPAAPATPTNTPPAEPAK